MTAFIPHHNYSLVTAILPRQNIELVLDAVLSSGAPSALAMNARGVLLKQHWYETLLPALSLEQEVVQFLLPTDEATTLMEQIVIVGKLHLFGAGSIFAVPCQHLECSEDYPLWVPGRYTFRSLTFDIKFKSNLIALFQVTERGVADAVAQSAIRAGASGATVSYIRGYGLRDRLGLLRVTKSHDKALVHVVVDEYDRDGVFDAMARAGAVDEPGRGLVFQFPRAPGLTNLTSVFQPRKHSASIQQIVRAIDELQGSADWRANQLLVKDPSAKEFASDRRGRSEGLVALTVVVRRKDVEELLTFILDWGVTGASVSSWRRVEAVGGGASGRAPMHREIGTIQILLDPTGLPDLCAAIRDVISERSMSETYFYATEIPVAKTFAPLRRE